MLAGRYFEPELELMPRESLEALRAEKLRRQLRYAYGASEFYREKFHQAGANPEDIRTLDDLRRLPIFITPEIHRRSQEESLGKFGHPFGTFLCAPLEEVVSVASTSGTTGEPTFYAFTRRDVEITNRLWARGFWRAGIRPGDTVMHAFGLSMFLAGVPVIRALEWMGARPIPCGAEAGSERLLKLIEWTRPRVLLCTPSYAEYLIEAAPKVLGREVKDLGIEIICCAGEPGAGLPQVRRKIQQAYNARIYDMLGGAHGILNVSCDATEYQGMHVVGDDFSISYDLVDPETKEPVPLVDGAVGERVKTSLDWEAQPPIRYSVGDVYQLFTKPCPCGQPGPRIKVIGRVDDLLIVKGVKVYPAAIKNLVESFSPRVTGEVRIVLDAPAPRVIPPLQLRVEYSSSIEGEQIERLKMEIAETMHDRLRVRPEIEMVPEGTLERTSHKTRLIERRYKKE
jgi:phenylacetate-CoA ligase